MLNKQLIFIILINFFTFSNCSDLTTNLHNELATHTNPYAMPETHPILCTLVKDLSVQLNVAEPSSITLYKAQYILIAPYNQTPKTHEITAHCDIYGNLHICYELIQNLSYNQIKGIVAIALSDKAHNRAAKCLSTQIATVGLLAGWIGYSLYKYQDLPFKLIKKMGHYDRTHKFLPLFSTAALIGLLPFIILTIPTAAARLQYNYFMYQIDTYAAQKTNKQDVLNGLKGILEIKKRYGNQYGFTKDLPTTFNLLEKRIQNLEALNI